MKIKLLIPVYILMLLVIFILPFYSAKGYSIKANTTSQLGGQNTPNAWVMNLVFLLLGLSCITEGWAHLKKFLFHKIAITIFGFSLILMAFFRHAPIAEGVLFDVKADQLHSLFATITGYSFALFAISSAFIEAIVARRILAVSAGIATTCLSYLIFNVSDYAGIWQRMIFIFSFAWIIYFFNNQKQRTCSDNDLKSVSKRFAGKGVFPYQMAFTLLIPFRNLFLSPKTLIKRLDLSNDHTVLEIGPGPGYFSLEVAKSLFRGTLYLFDIQQEMLDYARRRLEKHGQLNVQYHRASSVNFPFANNFFDRIFLVAVLGEVENREIYIQEIARTLKDGGLVSVSELKGDPDKIADNELTALFKAAGLECCHKFKTFWGFTINYKKKK